MRKLEALIRLMGFKKHKRINNIRTMSNTPITSFFTDRQYAGRRSYLATMGGVYHQVELRESEYEQLPDETA